MYYQESAFIAANPSFVEEDIAAVDEFLYQNQSIPFQLNRLVDFVDLDEQSVMAILKAYSAVGVVQFVEMGICPVDRTIVEDQKGDGVFKCDLCDRNYLEEQIVFQEVFVPRATKMECGDVIPCSVGQSRQVEGISMISGCSNEYRVADVVFVHGLDGAPDSTWYPKDQPDKFFPKWLGQDFPTVGVWTLGYNASSSGWSGTAMPMFDRASNILAILEAARIGERPLIFIVHSLGGLVLKQMIRDAIGNGNSYWEAIAKNVKAIMFIATPHSGSDISNYMQYIGKVYRNTIAVDELEAHHPQLRSLNSWFQNNCVKLGITVEVLFEKEKTLGVLVVNESSANPGIPGVVPIAIDADHATICKPKSKSALVYQRAHLLVARAIRD